MGGPKRKEDGTTSIESSTADKPDESAPHTTAEASGSPTLPEADTEDPAELTKFDASLHGRKASMAAESRLRSASFYRGDASTGLTSPSATSVGESIGGDIYRKQSQRIEDLERENKALAGQVDEAEKRWKHGEEELQELREGQGDVALAAQRGEEITALVRRILVCLLFIGIKRNDWVDPADISTTESRGGIFATPAPDSSIKDVASHVQFFSTKGFR